MSEGNAETFQLALRPNRTLIVSLFEAEDGHEVAQKVKETDRRFAIVDARRILSINQIVAAANTAMMRRTDADAFGIILSAAGSTNPSHVMRDYVFGEQSDELKSEKAMVVAVGLDILLEDFLSLAKQVGLGNSHSVAYFSENMSEERSANFIKWYKLTKEEVEMSSLEKALLTRIATKHYI